MWDGRLTHRPVGRLLVAVLVTLLSLVAVHGAGSADTPAGALATPHASIGAALHQAHSALGREDQETGSRRSAVPGVNLRDLPPPAPELFAVAVAAVTAPNVSAVAEAPRGVDQAEPRARTVPGPSSRAPPA
ncbi:hypothetical protein ACIBF5_10600 [Micromonospora sp. NPDC050417]|uniref:hypothetical protein n=1 Tax=Micromonospora sp. NPDC050417 TaxID=3364280 RepID=UPI003794E680